MKLKWWFSLLLGTMYLGVFHIWMKVSHPWVVASGLGVSCLLIALLFAAAKQGYFVNVWDGLFHASVILDIGVEGTWIERHEHLGFYLCAAGFAIVLIGYRLWWLRTFKESHPQLVG
jgi:hypothetical protein